MTELPPMATGGAPALGLALLNLLLSMLPDLVARNWQAVRSFGPGGVTVFNRIALSHPAALLPSCEHWQAVREHTHRAARRHHVALSRSKVLPAGLFNLLSRFCHGVVEHVLALTAAAGVLHKVTAPRHRGAPQVLQRYPAHYIGLSLLCFMTGYFFLALPLVTHPPTPQHPDTPPVQPL